MSEEALKELVMKHEGTLEALANSIEHLAKSQEMTSRDVRDTIKKLEEISKYLAKQSVFTAKMETMERELVDSFKRVHRRIDDISIIQSNDNGCNSVRLLTKDVQSLTKDITRLVDNVEKQRIHIERLQKENAASISPITIRWVTGIIIAYSITFGSYVVQTFSVLDKTNTRITALLERDMKDTEELMTQIKGLNNGK